MKSVSKKIIKASAGTGKTYRLSLEFINLLLSPLEQFEEILVITFTKKATAEIRNSILAHLRNIINGNDKGDALIAGLREIFGRSVSPADIQHLKKTYEMMLTNKHKLRISTIDSFVTTIFKGIIAPYMGIIDFEINNDINDRYLPEIYNSFVNSPVFFREFTKLFRTAKLKTIEDYDSFFKSILNNRWIIELLKQKDEQPTEGDYKINRASSSQTGITDIAKDYHRAYIAEMQSAIKMFEKYLHADNKQDQPPSKVFIKDYLTKLNIDPSDNLDWLTKFSNSITSEELLSVYWTLLIEKPQFWNGSVCLRKAAFKEDKNSLIKSLNDAALLLNEYIFYKYLLEEQRDIIRLSDIITDIYDRIKMRDHIFTYSDITYYTFKHLYDPELSMIDHQTGTVENRFYEYLSANTRFMLIDEYQDTSIIQHKILLPIMKEIISGFGAKEYGGVIIVGDEKQSIYGWRAGERDLLLRIPRILTEVEPDTLNTSYRSTPFVMEFINKLFAGIAGQFVPTFNHLITNTGEQNSLSSNSETLWQYTEIKPSIESKEGFLGVYFHNNSTSLKDDTDPLATENPHRQFVEKVIKPAYENGSINMSDSAILARTNNDIRNIADALEENGIPYYQEATLSVIHHQAVKPIICLLRYIHTNNILYLLQFLRSDCVLMHPKELKKIITAYNNAISSSNEPTDVASAFQVAHFLQSEKHPTLPIIGEIIIASQEIDLVALVSRIIQDFGLIELFKQEYHLKNINLFINVAADFLTSSPSSQQVSGLNILPADKSIGGFLSYLQENENSELLRQESLENVNALQLLSVHKSKGLQFESLFYYYKEPSGSGYGKNLNYYTRYDESLTSLEEGYLTLNYNLILKNKQISGYQKVRDLLEALNIIYVAITRAKQNIFLYIPYQHKNGIIGVVNDLADNLHKNPEKVNLKSFFIKELFSFIVEHKDDVDFNKAFTSITFGKLTVSKPVDHETASAGNFPYEKYISMNNNRFLRKPEDETHIDLKSVYIKNKLPLYGEAVHYYLSFLDYATVQEMEYAEAKTVAFFGNIIPADQIRLLIHNTNEFVSNNRRYFAENWNRVFTEKIVFSESGKEYRIDRLLVDDTLKKVLVIDFKTGSINDKDQLHNYAKIIAALPFVKSNNYQVDIEYLTIPIPDRLRN